MSSFLALRQLLTVGDLFVASALIMALASVVGGFVGAHTAQRMSARLLRGAVVIFGVIVAIKLMVKD